MGAALRPERSGFFLLHHDDDLTILHVVWAPRMAIYPHDHRMWAVIGMYTGQEDNAFYGGWCPSRWALIRVRRRDRKEWGHDVGCDSAEADMWLGSAQVVDRRLGPTFDDR